MTQFKGIKQVTKRVYGAMANADKIGYLFLVRDGEYNEDGTIKGDPTSEEIYFGTRKYGDTSHRFVTNVINSFDGLLDSEGGFILPTDKDFVSIDETKVDSLADILFALDAAIKANADKFASYYTKTEVDALISPLQTAINACLTGVSVKVGDATYAGAVVDGVATVDLSDAFEAAGKVKGVTVNGESVVNTDGVAVIEIPEVDVPFKTVKSNDKVLTLSASGELSSNLSYARETIGDVDSLVLRGVNNEVIGSVPVADFVADGMLTKVEEIGESGKFRFTFNVDKDGVEGEDYFDVDFSKFVDTYHADGTSITLNSETNTFSVNEVDASKTKLSTSIEVNGGPLADDASDNWPWTEDGKKVIPAGKTMEEILTSLFLKIIEGTVSFGGVSWSPGVAQPTVTLSKSGTIEVGTKVKATALTNGAFNKAKRSITLTTTQGYFDGDTYSDKTSVTFYSAESTASGTETISCTWNTAATDVTVNETELVTVEGTNTLTATQSGLVATVSKIPNKTVYASTNTKTKLTDTTASKKQVASISESQETYTSGTLSNSKSATVTAYYPIYTNGKTGSNGTASSETALVANDGTKLGLVADNTVFYVNFAPMIDGGTGYRLLVKSGKKITEAMALNTLNSKYEVDMKSSFVKAEGTVDKASGDTTFAYDVYEAKGSAGANAIRFKID